MSEYTLMMVQRSFIGPAIYPGFNQTYRSARNVTLLTKQEVAFILS